ncbi:GDSL-type esterase/lipase family protein [Streptomyces sp. NPDC050564]|uniref:GDSL-type esterase/lipase family protein n=1 Tax=Streptomyces sp. NPDC050564 TaxID=3365631 RepID=UPI003797753E
MTSLLRGIAWRSHDGRPLRADPADRDRLPADTWSRALVPAGVRLELRCHGASALRIRYAASEPSLADTYRPHAPVFTLLSGDEVADETSAHPTYDGTAVLQLPHPDGEFTVHLPEALCPVIRTVDTDAGTIEPTPARPRWLVHGDSIVEGWAASRPHLAWPAIAGRALGVDTVNLGYAGAARGELASAEQLASLDADLITVAFGTNCWARTPHSAPLLHEVTRAFLAVVRRAHPHVPLLVVSPVVRPGAEATPNRLGATLTDLRNAVERAAREVPLLPGGRLLDAAHLVDGVHPGDEGHALLAEAVVEAIRKTERRP